MIQDSFERIARLQRDLSLRAGRLVNTVPLLHVLYAYWMDCASVL